MPTSGCAEYTDPTAARMRHSDEKRQQNKFQNTIHATTKTMFCKHVADVCVKRVVDSKYVRQRQPHIVNGCY